MTSLFLYGNMLVGLTLWGRPDPVGPDFVCVSGGGGSNVYMAQNDCAASNGVPPTATHDRPSGREDPSGLLALQQLQESMVRVGCGFPNVFGHPQPHGTFLHHWIVSRSSICHRSPPPLPRHRSGIETTRNLLLLCTRDKRETDFSTQSHKVFHRLLVCRLDSKVFSLAASTCLDHVFRSVKFQ